MGTQIEYRLATSGDYNIVLEFIRQHFFPDEPLNLALQPFKQDSLEEKDTMSHITNGFCVIALSGEAIIGAIFAAPKYPDEEKKLLKDSSLIPNTKWGRQLKLLATLEKDSNVWQKYGVDKAMHVHALAVHKNFRGNRIGQNLMVDIMERATKFCFPLCSVFCTSVYSTGLCEDLDMDCVSVCVLANYREPDNSAQVFFPSGEHKLLNSFAKKLF